MPLRIKCPTGHTLIVPDDRAGRTLKCPRCDQPVVVPGGESDAVGRALLSVLAEGIPAANLAAGSLRVAPVESRLGTETSIAAEARAPSIPRKPPFPKSQAAPAPVVKPKSRALLAPPPPRLETVEPQPELVQPQPEPVELKPEPPKPEPPKPELVPIAPPAAVELPCPIVEPIAETIAEPQPAPPVAAAELTEPEIAPPITAEQPAPPPFVPRTREPVKVNFNADAARTLAVYQLAVALAAAALFSVIPAVWDVVEYLQYSGSPLVARWALGLFFLGVVQLAYAVYLFQLPDWTTVWVVTLFSLALAAVYAAALGLVLLSPADGFVVGDHGLQLADKLAGGKAALWCLCMVSLSTILAFFAGRQSTNWHQAELMLRATAS